MKTDKLISMMMPVDMIEQLKSIAESNRLSMSAQIRLVLMDFIKSHKDKKQ